MVCGETQAANLVKMKQLM